VGVDAAFFEGDECTELVAAVGESNYQEALSHICGSSRWEDVRFDCIAALVREPSNPYDSNAISVQVDGQLVGYLSREDASCTGALWRLTVWSLAERGSQAVALGATHRTSESSWSFRRPKGAAPPGTRIGLSGAHLSPPRLTGRPQLEGFGQASGVLAPRLVMQVALGGRARRDRLNHRHAAEARAPVVRQ
jgi:HIRAN domain